MAIPLEERTAKAGRDQRSSSGNGTTFPGLLRGVAGLRPGRTLIPSTTR